MLLIPAAIPPHKPVEQEPGAEHRLELCRLAVGDDERFEVSDVEVRRDGPSYTVDTLDGLRSHAPDDELLLIVGGDIAAGLPDWHEPERVLSLATVAVAQAARHAPRQGRAGARRTLRGSERARFFEMPRIGISSTMVRRRVGDGAADPLLRPRPGARLHRARGPLPVRCAGDGRTPTGVVSSDADTHKESMTNAPHSQPDSQQEGSPMKPEKILSAIAEHASTARRWTSSSSTCAGSSATPTTS